MTAAVGTSLVFFDFDFLVFIARALTSFAIGVHFDAGPVTVSADLTAFLRPSGGMMKLSALRTASLRPSGGGSMANRVETLDHAVAINRDVLGSAPWVRGKAVLPGELGLKHLVDPFCIG